MTYSYSNSNEQFINTAEAMTAQAKIGLQYDQFLFNGLLAYPSNDRNNFESIKFEGNNDRIETGGFVWTGKKRESSQGIEVLYSQSMGQLDALQNLLILNNLPSDDKRQKKRPALEKSFLTQIEQIRKLILDYKDTAGASILFQNVSPYLWAQKVEDLYNIDACSENMTQYLKYFDIVYSPMARSIKDGITVETGNITFTKLGSSTRILRTLDQMSMSANGVQQTLKNGQRFLNLNGTNYVINEDRLEVIGNKYISPFSDPDSRKATDQNDRQLLRAFRNDGYSVASVGNSSKFGTEIDTSAGHDTLKQDLVVAVIKDLADKAPEFLGAVKDLVKSKLGNDLQISSRYEGQQFGETIAQDESTESNALRLLMANQGTFKLTKGVLGKAVAWVADLRIDEGVVSQNYSLRVDKDSITECDRHGIAVTRNKHIPNLAMPTIRR